MDSLGLIRVWDALWSTQSNPLAEYEHICSVNAAQCLPATNEWSDALLQFTQTACRGRAVSVLDQQVKTML